VKVIKVRVHPSSSQEKFEQVGTDEYEVWVKAPADKDKANRAVLKLVKKQLGGNPLIKRGRTASTKLIMLNA